MGCPPYHKHEFNELQAARAESPTPDRAVREGCHYVDV